MYGLIADEQDVAKFKVGQRVRVVKPGWEDGGSHHGADVGSVHTISSFDEGYYQGEDCWFFKPHEIQPAFLPGDRVRVTKHAGYFAIGDTGEVERQTDAAVFVKHGSYQRIGLPIDADALELIAEPEAGNKDAAKPDPKFKAGDVVRALVDDDLGEFKVGDMFTITKIEGDFIMFFDANGDERYQPEDNYELATRSPPLDRPGPCIVARVLDGTPRPSNVPFVHASVASATVEAERLAKNNPGQEFAVYQRVAGRVAEVSYEMKEVA